MCRGEVVVAASGADFAHSSDEHPGCAAPEVAECGHSYSGDPGVQQYTERTATTVAVSDSGIEVLALTSHAGSNGRVENVA